MSAQKAFDAIADPVRREILRLLAAHAECSVSQLAESIDTVGRTGVSTHLRVLRTAGLVTEAPQTVCRPVRVEPAPRK